MATSAWTLAAPALWLPVPRTRRSVLSILQGGLDRQPMPTAPALESTSPEHDNLRGPDYYLMSPTTH